MTSSTSSMSHASRETPASEFLGRAFPFHLLVSHDLELAEIGPSLDRVIPTLVPGGHLGSHFDIVRPFAQPMTPGALRNCEGEVTVLRHRSGLELQGSVLETEHGYLVLCVPVVWELSTLARMGLTLRDFPPHDVTGDFLLLLQSTRTNMRALEKSSHDLARQRAELEKAHSKLEASLTEAEAAKCALAESERNYREVTEAIQEIVFTISPSGRFTFLNSAWHTTTGFTVADTLNRPAIEFFHPDDRGKLEEALACRSLHGAVEVRLVNKLAETRWYELRLGEHGDTDSPESVGVLHDVTPQREARLALEDAKHLAEEANQAKSDWLAAMSHEIRTPLHALMGMAALLGDTPLDPEQQHLLGTVASSADHLNYLLASLLDLEKIQQGQFDRQRVSFSPQQILEEAARLIRTRLRNVNVRVQTATDPLLPGTLSGEATRIRQVMFNLASNAAKFTDHGEVAISAGGEPGPDGTYNLHFHVTDTGSGIPAADQVHIFDRHFRARNATSVDGSGLGLHISRTITELLGGRIQFTSTEGQGTSFSVAFPCTLEPTVPSGDSRNIHAPDAPTRGTTSPSRLSRTLVVEDFQPSRDMARSILTRAGHAVDVAATGSEAVALAAQHRYDVILMDCQLPHFPGTEATLRIRAAERRLHEAPVPIVAVTAHALQRHREECSAAGMNDFVTKPVSAESLLRSVERWSDLRKTVLLVDDSRDCLDLYVASLVDMRTVAVTSGVDALVQLGRQHIDLVLLDIAMPTLDGYDTAHQIRRNGRLAGMPILACTGDESRLSRERAIQAGCTDVIVKPVNRATLLATIGRLLEAHPFGPAASPPAPRFNIPPELADAVPGYLEGITADLATGSADLDASRFDGVQSVAHNIKGTGTSFGFPELTRFARELEKAATDHDLARSRSALDRLSEHLRVARAAMPGVTA